MTVNRSVLILSAAGLLTAPIRSFPQTPAPTQTQTTAKAPRMVPSLKAVRLKGSIRIDGKLDEPAWASAPAATEFTQSYPQQGKAASEKTDARVLYDDDALYVGVRLYDSRPDSIAAQLARRDATGIYSDWVHVIVDSYHDRRTAFRFTTNPRGVQKDVFTSDDRNEDVNWDAVWEVATTVDSLGWTAEYRIPFSQLRFGSAGRGVERVWGLQMQRDIARKSERDTWSPWLPTDPGFVSFFGDVSGITDIPTPRRFELLPYVSTQLARAPGDAANPFFRSNATRQSVGADLKVGLPGGLTLTGTVNPDFGQVEADPAVVNLSAFESFFPEKRPFFVEGASLFNIGSFRSGPQYGFHQIFYSRRIGRSPQRFVSAKYVDAPDATTILGAGKVSGKMGPWTVAVLNALTAREDAKISDASGAKSETPVEPLTNYFVGRVRRDLRGGQTVISFGGTAVIRDLGDVVFKNLLRSRADVGSLDFEHQWNNRTYTIAGAFTGTQIGGARSVIRNAQLSSARYYQRPDADYIEVDTTLNVLRGYTTALGFQKSGTWFFNATAKQVSPGFEVNDLGFIGRADIRNLGVSMGYGNFDAGKYFRSYNIGGGTNHAWNFGNNRIWTSFFNFVDLGLANFWNLGGGLEYDPSSMDDRATRGGPLTVRPTQYGGYLYGNTDQRNKASYSWNLNVYGDRLGGKMDEYNVGLTLRPSSSVRITFSPDFMKYQNARQFVRSVSDPTATNTFGRRYVFAEIHQTQLSATTRVEWTLSPTLSFQTYAQPFTSSGHYSGFKEVARASSGDFNVYGVNAGVISPVRESNGDIVLYTVDPDAGGPAPSFSIGNPDFRTQSLRGNAVMRWEYRPGSTLFLVWQQQRSAFAPYEGDFRFGRDTRDIFGQPSNVFLVKATYWFAQ